jgi:hypothetical protein
LVLAKIGGNKGKEEGVLNILVKNKGAEQAIPGVIFTK